ncbi:MAG: Rrf2 family transcriptional regulator [Rhodospirillales bacterium]|nr:Rrf2 family transcriptional regulator [Rhodospirillales bacterium]MBN8899360.1 Rrf2 family transcriptional regulator [Rhodospirillales bacterium]
MRLTTFSDYSLRTLIYLGVRPGRLATIADIATAYDISANHLMKVVHQLAQAGDVVTVRGQHGGMRLARRPEEINIGAVVRRTEPDMDLVPCFGSSTGCRIQPACGLAVVLSEALAAFLAVLDRHTLADLLQEPERITPLLGIPAER